MSRNLNTCCLPWGMVSYHVVEDVVENAVFAWDLPVKNDTLPETNIAFGNKPSQKKMSSSNPQFLRAIVSFRDGTSFILL